MHHNQSQAPDELERFWDRHKNTTVSALSPVQARILNAHIDACRRQARRMKMKLYSVILLTEETVMVPHGPKGERLVETGQVFAQIVNALSERHAVNVARARCKARGVALNPMSNPLVTRL